MALIIPPFLALGAVAQLRQPSAAAPAVDGIQSLPLVPLTASTALAGGAAAEPPQAGTGLPATRTEPFSLLGVVWTDPLAEFHGSVEVRTRTRASGAWSSWRALPVGEEHAPDPGTAETDRAGLRGGTAPLWVGDSDAVQAQVIPDETAGEAEVEAEAEAEGDSSGLPEGLRLVLIDPGPLDQGQVAAVAGLAGVADVASVDGRGFTDEQGERDGGIGEADPAADGGAGGDDAAALSRAQTLAAADDHVGPRPPVVTRSGWGADESLRESGFVYTDTIRTAFVHHTAGSNDYACKDAAAVIQSIYRYHVSSLGWRDVGYNFFVDRCGTIYEGRAGGVAEPVQGAHTYGHNHNSMGVAVIGSYDGTQPSKRAIEGVSMVIAWKLGLFGTNPANSNERVSGGGRYAAGTKVRMQNVSGHRDGYATDCPGDLLYDELPAIRDLAARLQGR